MSPVAFDASDHPCPPRVASWLRPDEVQPALNLVALLDGSGQMSSAEARGAASADRRVGAVPRGSFRGPAERVACLRMERTAKDYSVIVVSATDRLDRMSHAAVERSSKTLRDGRAVKAEAKRFADRIAAADGRRGRLPPKPLSRRDWLSARLHSPFGGHYSVEHIESVLRGVLPRRSEAGSRRLFRSTSGHGGIQRSDGDRVGAQSDGWLGDCSCPCGRTARGRHFLPSHEFQFHSFRWDDDLGYDDGACSCGDHRRYSRTDPGLIAPTPILDQ